MREKSLVSPREQAGRAFLGSRKLLIMDFRLGRAALGLAVIAVRGRNVVGAVGVGVAGWVQTKAHVREGGGLGKGVGKQRWAPKGVHRG